MGDDRRELVIETASGRKVKTTLDAVRSLTARLGQIAPKMRDIALVKRKEVKGVPTVWVEYTYDSATESGHPDRVTREVCSTDPPHADFRDAWTVLEALLAKGWGVDEVRLESVAWKGGDAVVKGLVLGLAKIRGAVQIQASLDGGDKKMAAAVLELEQEALAYADRTKREQMELSL